MNKTFICKKSEVSPNSPFVHKLNDSEMMVIFQTEEGYFAVENRCPHAGALLQEGILEGTVLTCIWHGWKFDLESGFSLNENFVRLKKYELEIAEDSIFLSDQDQL